MFPGVGWKHLQWWNMTSISLHCGQIVADQNAKPIACTSDLNMHWTYESTKENKTIKDGGIAP